MHETSNHVGDEEACGAAIGQRKFDACGTVVGVGVVLLEDEVGFGHVWHVFEVVDDFDDGGLVVGRVVVGVRHPIITGTNILTSRALGYFFIE